jgi:hypothetical protein
MLRASPSCERREHLDRAALGKPYGLMAAGSDGVTVDEEGTPLQYARQFSGVSFAHGIERLGERSGRVRLLRDSGR